MSPLILIFIFWKVIDVIVSIIAPTFIQYLGFFSYRQDMFQYGMPDFIRALTNFDGIFYIRIALHGYSYTEQAYFPVYPLCIRLVTFIVRNPIIAGVTISNVAFIIAFYVLHKYLHIIFPKKKSLHKWILIMLLAYPTSYYFGVMYTESVFFMFFICALFFQKKHMYLLAFLCAYATALTRVVGVFLMVPLFFSYVHIYGLSFKNRWKEILVIFAPAFGLLSYCLYLWKTTGDPLFFFNAQESFGAQRSTHLIFPPHVIYRYIHIFLTASYNFQYFVAVIELVFYMCALVLLLHQLYTLLRNKDKDFSLIGLNLFSLINVVLPSLTGTLTAMPRYTLLSLSIFVALGGIKNKLYRSAVLGIFVALHVMLFAFFIQGYYVT